MVKDVDGRLFRGKILNVDGLPSFDSVEFAGAVAIEKER